MSEKKVIAVIVEGPSDENAIGGILKEELSDDFAEKYEGKVQDFIKFISDSDIAVSGTYKQTWKYIEKDKNSLQRHSNMHLIFE